ncbi:MFS transporter [Microbacterium lacticum]|uniref:MFS transporter n=1 Tax=Microbacterium lacticum TaxID=33885 RepID=UPI0018B05CC8|nr:MFS transporter [Microbacterium lacticum]MBF9337407.1 MFS transporter [Microbacterium lacticum]
MLSSPRNEDARFGFFAWSQSFSQMAAQIGAAAMPLIALALHVPDAQIGFVSLAQYAPVLLFTLVFGAWIDATSKLTPMLLAHAGRAGVFFTLAWLAAAGAITFPQLLIGVFIAGTFTSAFDVSVQGIIPQLVSSDRLIRANARIQLTYSIAQVVGPSAAGLLVGLGSPGMAFLIIAVTYTVAFIVLAPLRSKAVQAKSEKNNAELGVVRRLWEGMRFSFSDRVLVRLLTAGALFNLAEQALITTFLVYAGRNLGIPTTRLGMLLAAAGVGAVLAAAATRGRLQRSLTLTMLSWMSLATFAPLLLLAVQSADLTAYVVIATVFLTYGAGLVVYNVIAVSIRQHRAPDGMQSRVGAVYRFFAYGALGLGGLTSSVLVALCGVRSALTIIVCAMAGMTVLYVAQLWLVRADIDGTFDAL